MKTVKEVSVKDSIKGRLDWLRTRVTELQSKLYTKNFGPPYVMQDKKSTLQFVADYKEQIKILEAVLKALHE